MTDGDGEKGRAGFELVLKLITVLEQKGVLSRFDAIEVLEATLEDLGKRNSDGLAEGPSNLIKSIREEWWRLTP